MAVEWTPETFENHISAVFDEIEAGAAAARTTADISPLRDRLDGEWHDAKPGAFLPDDVFERLNARLGNISDLLTKRFVELRNSQPKTLVQVIIEEDGPTPETFFYGPHSSAANSPKSETIEEAEKRLGVRLPTLLRGLYALQDGGTTDYFLFAATPDAQNEYEGDESIIDEAYEAWMTALPGYDIAPLARLNTIAHYSDQIDFGDEDGAWRERIPETERLVAISNHGSDLWCCLGYREGRDEPKVVFFDDTQGEIAESSPIRELAPDFDSFFARLRRHGVTEEHGRRMRGLRQADPGE